MYPELNTSQLLLYAPLAFRLHGIEPENESKGYCACTFKLNERSVKFRVAKTTPTKTGQFVTLWQRNKNGFTQPLSVTVKVDLFVISVRSGTRFGQFVFTKAILAQNNILSTPTKEGKRGFRVYPPWDLTENKQARKTQQWQLNFFIEINSSPGTDLALAQRLYAQK